VTLVLALGAVSLTSAKGSTIHNGGVLAHLWLLFAFLSFIGAAAAAYQLWVRRYGAQESSEAAQRLNRAVFAVCAVLAVVLPTAFYLARPTGFGGDTPGCASCVITLTTQHGPTPGIDIVIGKADRPPKGLHLAPFLTVLGIVAALAVIAVVVYVVIRLLRRPAAEPIRGSALPAREMVDDAELARAMLAGRDALAGEARAAIIACYAAMEESLSAVGVPRLSSDSPADLLARAAAGGVIRGVAPARLAELFREARFSTHEMGAEKLTVARTALDEILAQVTARQEAARAAAQAAAAARAVPAEEASAPVDSRGRTGKQ
jgi:hypothetical protein